MGIFSLGRSLLLVFVAGFLALKSMEEEKDLYPVEYHFRLWFEEDCDDVFVSCYHSRQDLNCEGGVYIAEGTWVYPDGRFENW